MDKAGLPRSLTRTVAERAGVAFEIGRALVMVTHKVVVGKACYEVVMQ
jgi:hypothetical protein